MLTYSELIQLRDKLVSGELDLRSVQTACWNDFKEGLRSWHTKDWKERRAKVIKDHCEVCGSTDTLTLQHGSHPREYAEYVREVTSAYTKGYMSANPGMDKEVFRNYVLAKYDYIPVPFCPNCKLSNPYKRVRKIPQYRCATCKHEFDNPVYKSVDDLVAIFYENEDAMEVRDKCFVSKEWKNNNNLASIRYWLQREQAKQQDSGAIERKAFLLYLNDTIAYLSFEDTITACRKCAYNFDINKLDLCPHCKQHYKGLGYATCIPCLPEEKRKAALESIAFGKGWQAMHEGLDID